MKEIKFRAWFNLKNKMVESENLAFQYEGDEENPLTFAFDKADIDENGNEKGTMCFILMQFTGLYDKNGKEIYEGDIVRFHYKTGVYKIGTVVWNDLFGSWDIDCPDFVSYKSLGQYKSVSEVIGNIYEHKHLLEVDS